MSCQFHRTYLPAWVDEEQWFCNNGCHTNAGLQSKRCRIWLCFIHCYIFEALNYAISTEFPYLGGAILLTVKSDVVSDSVGEYLLSEV
jgi:hypothetical protein